MGMSEPVQTIEIYDFKEKHVRIPRGWELRVEGRFAKLATKLWDYFRKKGLIVQSYMDDVRIERVRIDGGDLMNRLMTHYEGSLFRDHDPEMVIVGRDTFRKMMGMQELQDYCGGPLTFNATGERFNRSGDPRDPTVRPTRTLFNLPVRVVSNMEGFAVVERGR
jgi:hypothetical protein